MLGSQVYLDGPNSLPKQGISRASHPCLEKFGIQFRKWVSLTGTHFPAFWGKIGSFSALINIINKYIFNVSLLLCFFLIFYFFEIMEHSSSPSKGYWTVFMPVVLPATLCNHWNPCIPITRTLDNAHHLWGDGYCLWKSIRTALWRSKCKEVQSSSRRFLWRLCKESLINFRLLQVLNHWPLEYLLKCSCQLCYKAIWEVCWLV